MSEVATDLHRRVLGIKDELDKSNAVLDGTLSKVDETSVRLEIVNDAMKTTLNKVF